MTDYKMVARICTDFIALYAGKKPLGIGQFYRKYENHPLVRALMTNLNETLDVSPTDALHDIYEIFKEYRGRVLSEKDWRDISDKANEAVKKHHCNRWCRYVALEFMAYLEDDSNELEKLEEETAA